MPRDVVEYTVCLAQTSQVLLSPILRLLRLASCYKSKEGFGKYVIREPRNLGLECRDGDPVLSGSPPSGLMLTGQQRLLPFSSLSDHIPSLLLALKTLCQNWLKGFPLLVP